MHTSCIACLPYLSEITTINYLPPIPQPSPDPLMLSRPSRFGLLPDSAASASFLEAHLLPPAPPGLACCPTAQASDRTHELLCHTRKARWAEIPSVAPSSKPPASSQRHQH